MQNHMESINALVALAAAIVSMLMTTAGGSVIGSTCTTAEEKLKTSVPGAMMVGAHALIGEAKNLKDDVKRRLINYDINCKERCIRSCQLEPGSKAEPNKGEECTGKIMAVSEKFDLRSKWGYDFECWISCRPSVDAEISCSKKK